MSIELKRLTAQLSSANAAAKLSRWFPKIEAEPFSNAWWAARCAAQRAFLYEACFTRDELDEEHPIKKFPSHPYIGTAADAFMCEKKFLLPASRRVLKTWIAKGCAMYRTLELPSTTIAYVTQKGGDGQRHIEEHVKRPMWDMLPPWLKAMYHLEEAKGQFRVAEKWIDGRWQEWGSWIVPYNQGDDQLRSFTHRIVFWDEIAFMANAEDMWEAVLPTIRGSGAKHGQLWAVSTVNPGSYFNETLLEPWNYQRARAVARAPMLAEAA